MDRDQNPQQQRALTTDRSEEAAPTASSEPTGLLQFKSSGDIPAVGGGFRARASDTDAAYEPTGSIGTEEPTTDVPVQLLSSPRDGQAQNVQLIRASIRPGARRNPKTGAGEEWSEAEHKWIPLRQHSDDGTSGPG